MKNKFLASLIIILLLCGCGMCDDPNAPIDAKEFLVKHPDIWFTINDEEYEYNRYTSNDMLNKVDNTDELFIFRIGDKTFEILMSSEFQQIGNTPYYVGLYGNA